MKTPLYRCTVASLHRFHDSTIQRFNGFAIRPAFILCVLFFSLHACAQFSPPGQNSARSISGQFIVNGTAQFSPLASSPRIAADTNLVRLEPALLAVSAERVKQLLWHRLEIKTDIPWRGQVFFALHPARSTDEDITIFSRHSADGWNYQVQLPDVLSRTRLAQALTGVLLLEFANRNASAHSAEIPAWLTDGLSQQLLAAGSPEFILSSPDKVVNGLPATRIDLTERSVDSLAAARRVLKNSAMLTFEELSWPTDAQLNGGDGGIYPASAQVFTDALLDLKNGPANLRAMLETLPQFYNWQLAFQSAFRAAFPRPLDLEKWWALQVVSFAAHDPGPGWTPMVSREKLDEILSVPVELRTASNSLPAHAEISLQAVIRNLDAARQAEILQTKLRDLGLAQLRVAPQFAALTDGYRRAIGGYLGELHVTTSASGRNGHASAMLKRTSTRDTLKKLDALDAQRRTIESTVKPDIFVPPSLATVKF
ncbi:MAG TPA: hypothetical protein VHY30_02665 [Verrucomicrobiae bacterium]|jgi:hypothetical protein|nr:hypothetical protein [Verrucomicrobiae bacterium]